MSVKIRLETPADYRTVEELTREAFWGCMEHPDCDEHLLVHKLRMSSAYLPDLDFVAEIDGEIVGNVVYSRSKIAADSGEEWEVITFGPLSVLPARQRKGVGSALMRHSIARARELGYRAIVIYGHPDYYPRFGFRRAREFGITAPNGACFDSLMAMPLYDGALEGISGKFYEDKVFQLDPKEKEEFDRAFPPKAPAEILPLDVLSGKLPSPVYGALAGHGIKYVAQLQRYSGTEIQSWEGIGPKGLEALNRRLRELGFVEKLPPSTYGQDTGFR